MKHRDDIHLGTTASHDLAEVVVVDRFTQLIGNESSIVYLVDCAQLTPNTRITISLEHTVGHGQGVYLSSSTELLRWKRANDHWKVVPYKFYLSILVRIMDYEGLNVELAVAHECEPIAGLGRFFASGSGRSWWEHHRKPGQVGPDKELTDSERELVLQLKNLIRAGAEILAEPEFERIYFGKYDRVASAATRFVSNLEQGTL